MATSFDTIEDLALSTVDDYKLKKLYDQSIEGFTKWLDSFLYSAVPNFYRCKQDLTYDKDAREFASDLTTVEISILADFWVLEWWRRELQNSAQIANKLQVSSSFTTHSPAQNFKEKTTTMDGMREKVHQKINDYLLEDLDSIDI